MRLFFPRVIFRKIRLISRMIYYYRIFSKYSSSIYGNRYYKNYEANIIILCHSIERSFSLPSPQKGFGLCDIKLLIKYIKRFIQISSKDNYWILTSCNLIDEWYQFNKGHIDVDNIYSEYKKFKDINIDVNKGSYNNFGGVTRIDSKPEAFSFPQFVKSRHSIRNFSDENISMETLDKVVSLALNVPSACNRQPVKIYVVANKQHINEIAKLQGGTNGFTDKINKILFISSDVQSCKSHKEIFQPYIEGGIFAMNLLYSLHWYNIGACILNWNPSTKVDKIIKNMLNIPAHDILIARVAIGGLLNSYHVAISDKRKVSEVLINISIDE